jgi:DNA ligase-1
MVSPYLGKWVLDGEVCILDENGDEHFDWVMKEITRKNHTIENPCYNVFDLLTQDEFDMKQESPRFEIRLMSIQDLCRQHPDDHIRVLKQERLKCQEDFDRWSGYVTEGHWEGFMLRRDVPYQRGRNKDLLKVKKFKDAEYVVVGTLNSKITYNEDGHKEFDACRALLIEHKGNQVQVGSGLSKEQRLRWYDHPEEIIGKTITVQYFEETKDSKTGEYSLRFPVLKFIYEDGRNV